MLSDDALKSPQEFFFRDHIQKGGQFLTQLSYPAVNIFDPPVSVSCAFLMVLSVFTLCAFLPRKSRTYQGQLLWADHSSRQPFGMTRRCLLSFYLPQLPFCPHTRECSPPATCDTYPPARLGPSQHIFKCSSATAQQGQCVAGAQTRL